MSLLLLINASDACMCNESTTALSALFTLSILATFLLIPDLILHETLESNFQLFGIKLPVKSDTKHLVSILPIIPCPKGGTQHQIVCYFGEKLTKKFDG